jgi:hypothetical protein
LGKTCSSGTQTNAEVAAKPLKLKAKMAAKKHGDCFSHGGKITLKPSQEGTLMLEISSR